MKKQILKSLQCKSFALLIIAMLLNLEVIAQCGATNFGSGYGATYASSLGSSSYTGIIGISGSFIVDVPLFTLTGATVYMDVNADVMVNDYCELDIISTDISSCNGVDMWNSIEASGSNARINIQSSSIQDGITAISLINSAAFDIADTKFNRNSIGLNVLNGTYTSATASLAKTDFLCENPLGSGIPALLLSPLSTQRSFAGINVIFASGVLFNAGSPTANIFNQDNGVYSDDADFTLEHTRIQDCDNGVYIKYNGTSGTTSIQNNGIFDCSIGINCFYAAASSLTISNNEFAGSPDGVYAGDLTLATFNLTDNFFNETTQSCADLYQVRGADIKVIDNYINYDLSTLTPLPFINTTTDYTTRGIRITNYVASASNTCRVNRNRINNIITGINIINVEHSEVQDNTIDFNIPYTDLIPSFPTLHTGIIMMGCTDATVRSNHITRPIAPVCNCRGNLEDRYMRGIHFNLSQINNKITDNLISYMSNAVFFENSCLGTLVSCNGFEECYSGVSLGKNLYSIFADISSQTGGAHRDVWTTNWIVDPTRRVTERNGSNITWHYFGFSGTGNPEFPDATWTAGSVSPVLVANSLECPAEEGSDPTEEERESMLGKIVRDVNEYEQYAAEFQYYADDFAYRFLLKNVDYINLGAGDDATYQDFYDRMQAGNIGKFALVQNYLDNLEYENAAAVINTIAAENAIEANKKTCLQIYLDSYASGNQLNQGQSSTLTDIAYQRVIEGGEGVIWARAMLHIEVNENAEQGGRLATHQTTKTISQNVVVKSVYPNPASNYLYIELENVTGGTVTLTDLAGKALRSQSLSNGTNKLPVHGLSTGMYFYQITSGNSVLKTNKLIIN